MNKFAFEYPWFLLCTTLKVGLFLITSPPKPVTTIETLIFPFIDSSIVEPIKISAEGSTSALILFAASSTSNKVISLPPVIFTSKPFAPFKV